MVANLISLALLLRPEQAGALNLLCGSQMSLQTMAYTQNSHEASRLEHLAPREASSRACFLVHTRAL